MSGSNPLNKVTPLVRECLDRTHKVTQLSGYKKRATAIRQIYLAINRGLIEDLPMIFLQSVKNRIPIFIREMRDSSEINEKYLNVVITTFSKFKQKYNTHINIQVEKTLLIRQLLGYDLSRVVNKYLNYE
jgi:hypothetical protein